VRELLPDGREDAGEAVCSALLRCYAGNLLELHAMPPPLTTRIGERPEASPLARH
jgi:hypothetical protein